MRFPPRLLVLLALLPGLVPAAAHASPGSPSTAAVTMGDSYISGEAGRWAGNSIDNTPGNDGTDRACLPAGSPLCQVDQSKVYIGGSTDGCHRSDVSELLSARLPVDRRFNIACSGAVAKNILRGSQGGTGQNGELPQGDQLLPIARAQDVKLVVVSVGGNDFGFASIVADCFERYASMQGPCQPGQQPKIDAAQPGVVEKVTRALADVRAVMGSAGYRNADYRLVVQTYPSVAPRAAEGRYGPERSAHGCPFYDSDANWARDHVVFQIGNAVKAAARANHAEVLDLANAFQGHEFCARTDRQATSSDHPDAAHSEWGRMITLTQGMTQELFHPNAYGQKALGTCLTGAAAGAAGEFACTGAAGRTPSGLTVKRTGTGSVVTPGGGTPAKGLPGSPAPLRIAVSRLKLARERRTCVKFHVTAEGHSVKGVLVSFAGRRAHTGRLGHATFCAVLSPARHRATARRAGYAAGFTTVKLRPLRIALVARTAARTHRTCATFRVTTSGRRVVKGARVSFYGRQTYTGRRGRATFCARLSRGRHPASARRAGYLIARTALTVRRRGQTG